MEKRRENLRQLDTASGRGVTFTTYASAHAPQHLWEAPQCDAAERLGLQPHVLEIGLQGGGALLQAGAFQYSRGRVQMRAGGRGGLGGLLGGVARAATGAMMSEAGRNLFEGQGVVWTEPTYRYLIIGEKDSPHDNYLLDDGAFYACEQGLDVSPRLLLDARAAGGNGLVSPELKGAGFFVLESPVPFNEIEIHELRNDEMRIDGDLILLFSSGLRFSVERFDRSWLGTARSGEGLVIR